MKLIAVYNAWSDCLDLLERSITNILPVVDSVLVVWSNKSNYGQFIRWNFAYDNPKVTFVQCEPIQGLSPGNNETNKRNFGLDKVRESFTHFMTMDCDEFYQQIDVAMEKDKMIREPNLNGLVCRLKVYIKEPTLWCEDHTLVPFIQKITPHLNLGQFRAYPFSYDMEGHAHIDPTRRPSHRTNVEMSPVFMHHMSYVRGDIDLKINNSTANLRRSKEAIYRDLANAKPGYVSELYHKELKECEDVFKIKGARRESDPSFNIETSGGSAVQR